MSLDLFFHHFDNAQYRKCILIHFLTDSTELSTENFVCIRLLPVSIKSATKILPFFLGKMSSSPSLV